MAYFGNPFACRGPVWPAHGWAFSVRSGCSSSRRVTVGFVGVALFNA
jgi:hypothetical protein